VSWCENPFWESAQNWGAALLVNLDSGLVRQVDGAAPWWWKSPAFSADSRRLAIPHPRGATMVVEGPSFQMVKSLPSAGCASFSPDGGRLALLTSEGMSPLRLFDTTSWETVLSLEVPQGFLFSAGFSPDGNVLALWSQFNRLVLWSAPSWADIAAAEGAAHDPRAPQSAPEPPTR
jgi:WD40 repeat protein